MKPKKDPFRFTVADGQHAPSAGIVIRVSIFIEHLQLLSDFHVVEDSSFDSTVRVPAFEAQRKRLDSGLQQATLAASDRKATFSSKYALVKTPTDFDLETDGDHFTSDSGAASDENKYFEKNLNFAYAEELRSMNTNRSNHSLAEGNPESHTLLKKIIHFVEGPQKELRSARKGSSNTAWSV